MDLHRAQIKTRNRAGETRFARRAFAGLALLLALGAAPVLAWPGVRQEHVNPVLAAFGMLALWAGLGVALIAQLAASMRARAWRLELRAVWLLAAMLITGLTVPLFEIFKQQILPERGFPLDPALAAIDRLMFFGRDGWHVTHALFGNVSATLFFDRCYAIWLPLMFAFPVLAVVAIADVRVRARLLGCWLMSWLLIGSLAAWALGSAGPIYYNALVAPNASFAELQNALAALAAAAHAKGQVIAAIDFQALLLSEHSRPGLAPAGGISAMPSMHVAMAVLFAIGSFHAARWLGWLMSAYALAIWIGSVHLGWHYAIDGLVGAAMMGLLWLAAAPFVADRKLAPQSPLSQSGLAV